MAISKAYPRKVVLGKYSDYVNIYNLADCKKFFELPQYAETMSVDISDDGSLVVAASKTMVKLWDAESYGLIRKLEDFSSNVMSVAINKEKNIIVTGDLNTVGIWNLESGEKIKTLAIKNQRRDGIKFNRDGNKFVVLDTRKFYIIDTETLEEIARHEEDADITSIVIGY